MMEPSAASKEQEEEKEEGEECTPLTHGVNELAWILFPLLYQSQSSCSKEKFCDDTYTEKCAPLVDKKV